MGYLEDGLGQDVVNVEAKVFIEDDGIKTGASQRSPEWVDFTERIESSGINLLKQLGVISQNSETKVGVGAFASTIRQITFDNTNNFFNKPIDREDGTVFANFFGNSYPSVLKTILANTAYFTHSRFHTLTVYGGRRIRVDARVQLSDGSVSTGTLGVFLIEGISRDTATVVFTLTSLAQPLLEREASVVKDGLSWYSNRPVGFLVEKLLEVEYADSNGDLPTNFNIEDNIRIQTAGSLVGKNADNRTISHYGRSPERSGGTEVSFRANAGSDSGATWLDKSLTTRAMVSWNFGTNPDWANIILAAATDNASTVHIGFNNGSDLDIDGEWDTDVLRPSAGDVLRIKNDTVNGNDGFYNITNVNESSNRTVLSLATPLKGTAISLSAGGVEFNISRLYMGCDDQLWCFRPHRDIFTSIDITKLDLARAELTNVPAEKTMNINRLWFDARQKYIIGAAWHDEYDGSRGANFRDFSATTDMQIFKVALSAGNDILTTVGANIPNVFTGEFCLRQGRLHNVDYDTLDRTFVGQAVDIPGESDSSDCSENLMTPFNQKFVTVDTDETYSNPGGCFQDITFSGIDTVSTTLGSNYWGLYRFTTNNFQPGYRTVVLGRQDSAEEANYIRFSYGQNGYVVFNERSEAQGAVFYSTFDYTDTSDENFDYFHFNVSLATSNTIAAGEGLKLNSIATHPTAGCEITGQKSIAVGLQNWKHNGGSGAPGECRSYIQVIYQQTADTSNTIGKYRFLGTPAYSSNLDTTSTFRTFTDIVPHWENSGSQFACNLLVSGLDRDKIAKNDLYFLGEYNYDGSTASDTITERRKSSTPMAKLVTDSVNSVEPVYSSYFTDPERGFLYHYLQDTSHTFTLLGSGHPYVIGDSNMSSNLTLDYYSSIAAHSGSSTTDTIFDTIVYGSSAPTYPAITQHNPPSGKYYLWKYDVFYTSRVELADFEGLKLWDVLKLFAEKVGYTMGWDGDRFFFVPRDVSKTIAYTFDNSGDNLGFTKISVTDGVKEIYNVCSIIPSVVTLEQPSTELKLVSDPVDSTIDRSKMKMSVQVEQRDTQTKSIKLQCVTGGVMDGNNIRFKYIYYSKNIESTLGSTYEIVNTYLNIASGISDVKKGDLIEVHTQEKSAGVQITEYVGTGIVANDPSSADLEESKVTLTAVLENFNVTDFATVASPANYPIGSSVIVTKVNSDTWSDSVDNQISDGYFEEVLTTNWTATSCTETLFTTSYVFGSQSLKITDSESSSEFVSQTISGLKPETTYALLAFAKADKLSADSVVNHSATVDISGTISGWEALVTTSPSWEELSGTFVTGAGETSVTLKLYSNQAGAVYFDGIVVMEGHKARPDYMLAYRDSVFYEIGDSNVFIKFVDGNANIEGEEARFEVGDIIEITCPGLVLSADTLSKQTTINATSVQDYRRREFPVIQNRFLGHLEAKDMTEKIVSNFAFPHNTFKLTSKYAPFIRFVSSAKVLSTFKIVDNEMLPYDLASGRTGYMRKIEHNPTNGVTTIIIRDSEPY